MPRFVTPSWTTLGGDPEVAIVNSNGGLVKAKDILDKRRKDVEVDGFFAELHPSPETCRENLATNYKMCLETLLLAAERGHASVKTASCITVDDETLENAEEDEVELGCEPDFDAYTGEENKIEVNARTLNFRTGGGHLHFGKNCAGENKVLYYRDSAWHAENTYENVAYDVIKTMDYLCGLPSILLDPGDGPRERRRLYGKAGAFRIQRHGIEYRVLSNFWVQHASLMSVVYLLGRVSLIIATEFPGLMDHVFNQIPNKDVQQIINENNEDEAKVVFQKLKLPITKITDYRVIPFIYWVNEIGKENIYKESLIDNWRINLNNSLPEEWWGMGRPGMHNFLTKIPPNLKGKFNKIAAREEV